MKQADADVEVSVHDSEGKMMLFREKEEAMVWATQMSHQLGGKFSVELIKGQPKKDK